MRIPLGLFILLLLAGNSCLAQNEDFKTYYPGNELYKKLGVKSSRHVFDSATTYISEFDTAGRLISCWQEGRDSKECYRYGYHKDTLVCHCFYSSTDGANQPIGETQKFLYNADNKVILYTKSRKDYTTHLLWYWQEKFFYDEKGLLTTRLVYMNKPDSTSFSPEIILPDNKLELIDGYNYFFNNKNQLVLQKQIMGPKDARTIDSFFYDKQQRLVKRVNFIKNGYLFCRFIANDIRNTSSTVFGDSTTAVTSTCTYNNYPEGIKTHYEEAKQYTHYNNGLIQTEKTTYSYYTYQYEFYPGYINNAASTFHKARITKP